MPKSVFSNIDQISNYFLVQESRSEPDANHKRMENKVQGKILNEQLAIPKEATGPQLSVSSKSNPLADFDAVKNHKLATDATIDDLFKLHVKKTYYEPTPSRKELISYLLACKEENIVSLTKPFPALMTGIILFSIRESMDEKDADWSLNEPVPRKGAKVYYIESGMKDLQQVQISPKNVVQVPSSYRLLANNGSKKVYFELVPNYNGFLELTAFGTSQMDIESFINWIQGRIDHYNFLRGARIDGNTHFLTIDDVSQDDLILEPGKWEEIQESFIETFTMQEELEKYGIPFKLGIGVIGEPGCGKTTMFKVIANMPSMKKVTIIIVTPDSLKYGASSINALYDLAEALSPTMIVFEDADNYLQDRSMHMGNEGIMTEIMNRLSGVKKLRGVVTVITTNRPEVLESAIISRADRIDKRIYLPPPNADGRAKILKKHLMKVSFQESDVVEISKMKSMEGLTGCDIPDIAYRAIRKAIKLGNGSIPNVTMSELSEALDDIRAELKMIAEKGNYTQRGKSGEVKQESRLSHALNGIKCISESFSESATITESATFESLKSFMSVFLFDSDSEFEEDQDTEQDLNLDDVLKGKTRRKVARLLKSNTSKKLLRRQGVTRDAMDAAKKLLDSKDCNLRNILVALSGDD